MKKLFYFILGSALLLTSCAKHEFDAQSNNNKVKENVEKVFGVTFDPNHDWCTTSVGSVTINNIPNDVDKIRVLSFIEANDTTTSMFVLNEANVNGESSITLKYDIPSVNKGIYVFDGKSFKKVNGDIVSLSSSAKKPIAKRANRVPSTTPVLAWSTKSYANIRGWVDGEMLYGLAEDAYSNEAIAVSDYDEEYKTMFRGVVFSYFKNGREYNNLSLILESQYFNEKAYPITTGDEPIVVSPVYKSDKAKKYGNEVWNSDLYYYYFKESELAEYVDNGGSEVTFLENLPKYKAIPFNQHFGEEEDDVIEKRASYTLIYWGDGTPTLGTEGSYLFPNGYKIGFMVRAKTDFKENGKARKQGELYGDGRLNNYINNYSECNFKGSKLGKDGPRMGWINLNGKMLLTCESGTDSDFNDIILEVEGGVEEIKFVPEFDYGHFTFCFEDRELGDYDMNDIVIKASRINETTVEYSIVACGACDKLYIKNIVAEWENQEVHSLFGVDNNKFINTVKGDKTYEPIVKRVTVNENFSFLDETTQPYIFDASTNKTVHLSMVGEDPHGIMIPYDFRYPIEYKCIKYVYPRFNKWGVNRITSTNWYKYFVEELVY
jgi:hypothetical protein